MYFCHILPNFQFYMFVFHSNMNKHQGHLKVKVNQYQMLEKILLDVEF